MTLELHDAPDDLLAMLAERVAKSEAPSAPASPDHSGDIDTAQRILRQTDPSCDYDTWLRLGMALENDLGQVGWDLWNDWSATSSKYPGAAQLESHWNSFKGSPNPVTLGSFKRTLVASKDDFEDVSGDALDDPFDAVSKASTQRESVSRSLAPYKFEPGRFEFIDYYVDGFIGNGLTVIGGGPGVGKTTLIVPLAGITAGLFPASVKAEVRRRVVYLAEQPGQVADILAGLNRNVEGFQLSEVNFWFTIIPSKRKNHEAMRNTIKLLREQYRHEVDGLTVEPLIVLDTSNANIELESENDNAEVGRVIAAIKEELGAAACWLICHTPKAVGRADVEKLTMRGAFAFEGDCNQTAFVFLEEGVEDKRFMAVKKVRFEPEFWELEFKTSVDVVTVPGINGRADQTRRYRYGVPVASTAAQRLAQRPSKGRKADDPETSEAIAKARATLDAALADLAKRKIEPTRRAVRACAEVKAAGYSQHSWDGALLLLVEQGDVEPAETKAGNKPRPITYTPEGDARRVERVACREGMELILDDGEGA